MWVVVLTAVGGGIQVQQIALLMGCGVLPYLKQLVDIVQFGLGDEQQKVRVDYGG